MDPNGKSVQSASDSKIYECDCVQCQLTEVHRKLVSLGMKLNRDQQMELADPLLQLGNLILRTNRLDAVANYIEFLMDIRKGQEEK